MTCGCNTDSFPDLTGKVILGRSVPGYDYISEPQTLGSGPMMSDMVAGNGHTMTYQQNQPIYKSANIGTTQKLNGEFPWGVFLIGGIIGFVFAAIVLTPSGRSMGQAAFHRTAKKIRGN